MKGRCKKVSIWQASLGRQNLRRIHHLKQEFIQKRETANTCRPAKNEVQNKTGMHCYLATINHASPLSLGWVLDLSIIHCET